MARNYKNPHYQSLYNRLFNLGSPEALLKHHIAGAILDAFTCGYNGVPIPPRFKSNKIPAYFAYYAGKDASKKRKNSPTAEAPQPNGDNGIEVELFLP